MAESLKPGQSAICGVVTANGKGVVAYARVQLLRKDQTRKSAEQPLSAVTDAKGRYCIPCPPDDYKEECSALGSTKSAPASLESPGQVLEVPIDLELRFKLGLYKRDPDADKRSLVSNAVVGQPVFAAF